jgi:hypothetical protein
MGRTAQIGRAASCRGTSSSWRWPPGSGKPPAATRLLSTAVLGFAASEAGGRFGRHEQAVIDADFAELLR